MTSNSKLDNLQKEILQDMRENDENVTVVTNGYDTVIAFEMMGENVRFATAIKSPDEKKFRFKVGEYHARCRLDEGRWAILTQGDFDNMRDVADLQHWADIKTRWN